MRFVFADCELDDTVFELRRGGEVVHVEPQVLEVLVYLARHPGRLVSKDEMLDSVWGGRFVSESALTSRIKQARRAVGDDGEAQRVIRTVHGRGYRFLAPVVLAESGDFPVSRASVAPDAVAAPDAFPVRDARGVPGSAAAVHYTVSDGLHIAYQVTGGGDLDIVLVSGFISHLELDWGDPRHAYFLDRLGSAGRLIRFDKRGTGMSDRPAGLPDLETRMHDVVAVMDACGSQQAALVGYSEGGPLSILFAATHPERVRALVLYGTYATRQPAPDYPWAPSPGERAAYTEQLVTTWDWEADMRRRCPSADDDMRRWWARRARAAATPSTVRALRAMNARVDVRAVLPAVRVPTLVVQRTGDALVQPPEGRFLAERIRGARFVELPGEDHFVSGDPAQILDVVIPFLSGLPAQAVGPATAPDLALAAVVAVAGEGAEIGTAMLGAAGGRVRHDRVGRRIVLFDGPATAIRACLGALPATGSLSYGVAVGEVSRDAPLVDGQAVTLAWALASAGSPGRVMTSRLVGELLAASGITLREVGSLDLGPAGRHDVLQPLPA